MARDGGDTRHPRSSRGSSASPPCPLDGCGSRRLPGWSEIDRPPRPPPHRRGGQHEALLGAGRPSHVDPLGRPRPARSRPAPAPPGREIDKTDGFLLLFEDTSNAVAYALAYHQGLRRLDPPLSARAGLHVGEVTLTETAPEFVTRGATPLQVNGIAKPTAAWVMSVALGG